MATHVNTHLASTVGLNIVRARLAKGMTQQQLATALGTSISRVSGWEQGNHLPHRRQHQPLATLLFDGDIAALYREALQAA